MKKNKKKKIIIILVTVLILIIISLLLIFKDKLFSKETINNTNINENTIVEALVLDNYVKNKKQTRYNILHNYLSNKTSANMFKNRYQVEQAIKHINDEMDEASKEFSKLFASNGKEYT